MGATDAQPDTAIATKKSRADARITRRSVYPTQPWIE
jgi:hypothetical protein